MNAQTKFELPAPDYFDRMLEKGERLSECRAMLGEAILGLNLAARTIDRHGGDGSMFREIAARAYPVRWGQ